MSLHHIPGAAWRALTFPKEGPSLYDVCDPVLLRPDGGNPHLAKFYLTALANPALRPLLRRAGLPELNDPARLDALRSALRHARDDQRPDWAAIGRPVAELLDTVRLHHPQRRRVPAPAGLPK